ncbi:MAG: hypothetical protein RL375_3868 [Pseudomonadota bacterium]|jgi:hypothetical protein
MKITLTQPGLVPPGCHRTQRLARAALTCGASVLLAVCAGCIVVPAERHAPRAVVLVEPAYPSPGVGWVWEAHPRHGWGWRHRAHGWHRGWR